MCNPKAPVKTPQHLATTTSNPPDSHKDRVALHSVCRVAHSNSPHKHEVESQWLSQDPRVKVDAAHVHGYRVSHRDCRFESPVALWVSGTLKLSGRPMGFVSGRVDSGKEGVANLVSAFTFCFDTGVYCIPSYSKVLFTGPNCFMYDLERFSLSSPYCTKYSMTPYRYLRCINVPR